MSILRWIERGAGIGRIVGRSDLQFAEIAGLQCEEWVGESDGGWPCGPVRRWLPFSGGEVAGVG